MTDSRLAGGVVAVMLALGTAAQAQQPLDPYGVTVAAPVDAPAPQPLNPYPNGYGYYPPPPAYGYQAPSAGPGYQTPTPAYQQGYYLYPTEPSAPVYAPPPCCCRPCELAPPVFKLQTSRPRKLEHIRRVSLGVHGTVFGINQTIGTHDMVLGGAGLQLRIRSQGRFGLELSQSFLHASYGDFQRTSLPFAFSLMFYVFPNRDARHFNIYALAGVGLMYDAINLRDENSALVEQDFVEWTAHVGVGAELRFKWFAIEADARLVGMLRDDLSAPASYYSGVSGGPIPSSSYGGMGNVYVSFWF
jgi:hypothetical protein